MKVSLILTVLNEADHLRRLLESVVNQSRRPEEIVVCDGGSRDNTVAVIQDYQGRLPLKLISVPGSTISQGRNAAIRQAIGEVIAVTDAGVWLEACWLEALLAAGGWTADDGRFQSPERPLGTLRVSGVGQLMDDRHSPQSSVVYRPSSAAVAGFYKSDPKNTFEVALGATTLPEVNEINPATFLPSSRSVAFLKQAWEAVGGYPEWLDYSEDVVFDLKLRRKFGAFGFAPQAIAHFRPRSSLKAFAKQYFNYAKGDGQAGLWGRIHFIRYFTYLVAAPLGAYAALTVSPWLWLLGAAAGLAYIRRPLQRLSRAGQISPRTLAWVPVIRVVGDVAKMLGYPVGVWERFRKRVEPLHT